jgi:hypothetical protein
MPFPQEIIVAKDIKFLGQDQGEQGHAAVQAVAHLERS